MENLTWAWRSFYGIAVSFMGVQQIIYSDFRPMVLSNWPASFPGVTIPAYISGALLVIAGLLICLGKKARLVSILLGIFFLLLFLCFHAYFLVFLSPYDFHLGLWTDALKELAFAGGAFIVAASFPQENSAIPNRLLLPLGRVFFCIMLISFGIDHFLYTEFVAGLVPRWIPGYTFWTYLGGIALIGSGVLVLLKIKIRLVCILAGAMMLIWFFVLHIPRAIADPNMAKGNEVTSVFQALAFAGIFFLLSVLYGGKRPELTKKK